MLISGCRAIRCKVLSRCFAPDILSLTIHVNVEMASERELKILRTPRAAAIAGILFGVLFATSLALIRLGIPENLSSDLSWLEKGTGRIQTALGIMPFAGIAFLWFIGVIRDRHGKYEDRFFTTVFFGSSLLFLAMVFVSMALAGGIIAFSRIEYADSGISQIIYFGRAIMFQISNVYALRMAGVSMISLGTIWLQTGLMPRWLAFSTYLLALVLLVVINYSLWIALLFPVWVIVISSYILIKHEEF